MAFRPRGPVTHITPRYYLILGENVKETTPSLSRVDQIEEAEDSSFVACSQSDRILHKDLRQSCFYSDTIGDLDALGSLATDFKKGMRYSVANVQSKTGSS